jgi:hypothetical protein
MDWLLFIRQLLLSDGPLAVMLLLIVGNFLLAVLAAARTGIFDWRVLATVFLRDVLPKAGGYLVLRIILAEADQALPADVWAGLINGTFSAIAVGAWLVIVTELIARIGGHLQTLGLVPHKEAPDVQF